MQDNKKCDCPQFSREYTLEELCCTVFYMARYAESLEIDEAITVENEVELFWLILEWAQDFEQSFDPSTACYTAELECQGPRWLRATFPYKPELDEEAAESDEQGMTAPGM